MKNGTITTTNTLLTILNNLTLSGKAVIMGSALLISGCCTKKECYVSKPEAITFLLNNNPSAGGFNVTEIDKMVVVVYNPATGKTIDSGKISSFLRTDNVGREVYAVSEIENQQRNITIKNANIIIKTTNGSFADTLFAINFKAETIEYTCNTCFLAPETPKLQNYIAERTLLLNGREYKDNEFPILISK